MKSGIKLIMEPLLIILGILLVSSTSALFEPQTSYWERLLSVLKEIAWPQDLVYVNPVSEIEREVFPILFSAFFSSARIVFLALVMAIVNSLVLLVCYFFAGTSFKALIKSCSVVISSLPDIFVIAVLQIFVILFFKSTGVLLIDVASTGENQVILFPAVALSILPTFFFLGLLVSFLNEEEHLSYVELARGKGLNKYRILFIHMIRNILISVTYHGKQIVWMMLSNLLILEYLFNVFGVTSFLFSYNSPSIFAITSILLFIPIYLLLKCLQWFIKNRIGREMSL
ncbi:ABC transporter permease subunit [Rossellomorea aquimaris]|uniref:ABC transporter permease subunit n=1 Tax=Rossellomorea aquimaris TaxID=189382 RepID=UPI001CD33CF8|nr:ABC transporter permease subunit [Rossellomorea aquimaris]MCA1054170.1 ABC transporter permease subunit [Rossellomorea aquimaris]